MTCAAGHGTQIVVTLVRQAYPLRWLALMDEGLLWAIMMQRLGGWCAIAGAGLLLAAGIGFGGLTLQPEAEVVLQELSQQPGWYWPAVHGAFVAGAFLWIIAFMGLNTSFRDVPSRVLGHPAAVCLMLGVGLHAVHSFVSGTALNGLAGRWLAAPLAERLQILQSAETLLSVLGGLWTGVMILFHGVPFVLMGAAVARDSRFPHALRWSGVMGGTGSILTGALMLTLPAVSPVVLVFLFGAVSVLWMLGIGIVLKRPAGAARRTQDALQAA